MASGYISQPVDLNWKRKLNRYGDLHDCKVIFSDIIEFSDYEGMVSVDCYFIGRKISVGIECEKVIITTNTISFKIKYIIGNMQKNMEDTSITIKVYGEKSEEETVERFDVLRYIGENRLMIFIGRKSSLEVIQIQNEGHVMYRFHYVD
jgi:hypothetical protein